MKRRAAAAQPGDSVVSACRNSSHGALARRGAGRKLAAAPASAYHDDGAGPRAMSCVSSREPPSQTVRLRRGRDQRESAAMVRAKVRGAAFRVGMTTSMFVVTGCRRRRPARRTWRNADG